MPVYSSPNVTQTANGKDLYLLANPVAGTPDTINGSLVVNGSVTAQSLNTITFPQGNVRIETADGSLPPGYLQLNSVTNGGGLVTNVPVNAPRFNNTTSAVVSFTTPTYAGTSPPADATQVFNGRLQPLTATTFSVSALSNYKSLKVRVVSGAVVNNLGGAGNLDVNFFLCSQATVPADGAPFSPNVFTRINASASDFIMPNGGAGGTSASIQVAPPAGQGQMDRLIGTVVIPYPQGDNLTLWDLTVSGADHAWVNTWVFEVTGIL